MAALTARKVATLKEPGMYGDGGGLYLRIGPTGGKSWILRTAVYGKRRSLGLGSASLVGLAEAREKARELRKIARDGGDPFRARRREELTFAEAAARVHAEHLPTWRNAKHAETWLASIERYAVPVIGDRPLPTLGMADILMVLSPIWSSKHETAKRLKQRLSTVFDWAKGHGHYPHENPVSGVSKSLPKVDRRPEHMPAMHWQGLPGFWKELQERDGVSARTLEFIILTATRSGEARGARWSEIDLPKRTWTIPAERMKRGIAHRVPLSDEAVEVLKRLQGLDDKLVFPSASRGKDGKSRPQSVMVFKSLLKRMGREDITTHGFRSTFRDWCGESAKADREVAEAALSHAVGNDVERAYARSDLFERRRTLMDAWAAYATGTAGTVTRLVRA
ncbi:MAG: integrase arm-type DNA-binding domain-containing protein [Pseudomonadota bacterium]